MILDYPHPVDFSNNKSLRRLRRWLSFKMANYIAVIEDKKQTDRIFKNSQNRICGSDFLEASRNLSTVQHWHWAINEIIKHEEKQS